MAASVVHIPLAPMTLEINAVSSEYVTWTYRWKNVDLSADFETYSPNFGHPDGWVWRMLFQQNVDAAGNRVYGIFLYVVMTDNELQERTWTRDIRYLQFCILNSEGRQLKDKTTVALYRENQLSWGFPGLLDNSILLRDPVVNSRRTIDIVCRLRYHPNQEKLRRPMSPTIPASLLSNSIIGNGHSTSRTAPNPASYWDQQKAPHTVVDLVGKHLKKLLNSREFSDLEIVVGPEQKVLYAHKAILAARSEWFRSALRPAFREAREGRITVLEDDPKIFEALLEFLYTGEYPLSSLENNVRTGMGMGTGTGTGTGSRMVQAAKPQTPIHFSPRSPPTIPPRVIEDSSSSASSSSAFSEPPSSFTESPSPFAEAPSPFSSTPSPFSSTPSPFTSASSSTEDAPFTYTNTYEREPDEDEELDDQKFQLFLMADKYGVTQLKTLIRLHLTNDLLDTSNNLQPGQRLIRLIRFAFEELPETALTRTPTRSSGRDSGVGNSLSNSISERGPSPSHPFGYSSAGMNGFPFNDLENREGTASAFGHNSEGSDVGVAMTTERRSLSRVSQTSTARDEYAGIYGRDNETNMLRESITSYVAKMFHAVRNLDGFVDLLREGGEMGGFVKMVLDSMYRP
ncbi:hypothetical protein BZA05DRAFT_444411 [Tricharina praecox]|uniref:uncharacterized protein n=1 Tax=Tricharina praecox TaxID=43433 RepID=UPI00221F4CA8|nr:uncharacterized protein BZA05DRAFT_444411 [Tricharina praecox]KAI5853391.1 hypothetical protein BZA05DRAFT_444411 [Tricharina praecox]